MGQPVKSIQTESRRAWSQEDLEAPGLGKLQVISLESEKKEREELLDVIRSARTENGTYLRRAIQKGNRASCNALHPDLFSGGSFIQLSCQGSAAQQKLTELAEQVVGYYEARAEYELDPDPEQATWRLGEHRPRSSEMVRFNRAAHAKYAKSDFNHDEFEFASALDRTGKGVWLRNPPTSGVGYSIPLPAKVGESNTFYPDFLWWVNGLCWAIDTTGAHLINAKIRGKLFALQNPRVALAVRGKYNVIHNNVDSSDGWSLVTARPYMPDPAVEYDGDLQQLLARFAKQRKQNRAAGLRRRVKN